MDPTPRLQPGCPGIVPLPKNDELIPWSHMGIQHPFKDSGLHGYDHKNTSTNDLHITLFEKAHNLHLYIPPHSAHLPGVLPGIVYSTLFRIFSLCSCKHNKITWTEVFQVSTCPWLQRKPNKPLFHKAITHAQQYTGPPLSKDNDNNQVILHLPFHPNDPMSFKIQAARRTHVSYPHWKMPLENMTKPKT